MKLYMKRTFQCYVTATQFKDDRLDFDEFLNIPFKMDCPELLRDVLYYLGRYDH